MMDKLDGHQNQISRRQFLKFTAASLGALALRSLPGSMNTIAFPDAEALGRVNSGVTEVKARPDSDSATVTKLYEDAIVPWLREVVGRRPYRINQRWVETPQGYIWAAELQPVKNQPNQPLQALKQTSQGPGMWAEISIPYVDAVLDNPPARSPWLKDTDRPRFFYSQVFWIDQVKTDAQGQVWYRINEKFGFGDLLWARAEAFRPLAEEETLPIHPQVADKRVVIDVPHQTLSCFEGKDEVYFARVSTGVQNDMYGNTTDKWATPDGIRPVWRKLISVHMTGGTTGGGYDLPGVSWTTLFEGSGVAIHSTFWHNNFGEPMSHGCVNAAPDDAKWVFRWTQPEVAFDPGDITVKMPGGTLVEVRG